MSRKISQIEMHQEHSVLGQLIIPPNERAVCRAGGRCPHLMGGGREKADTCNAGEVTQTVNGNVWTLGQDANTRQGCYALFMNNKSIFTIRVDE